MNGIGKMVIAIVCFAASIIVLLFLDCFIIKKKPIKRESNFERLSNEILDIHKSCLDYYLHEHRLSWQFIGIGWATNVGLLTVFFAISEANLISTKGAIMICLVGIITNAIWWLALQRNEVYKDALASEGVRIEKELDDRGLHVYTFRTRDDIRKKNIHPGKVCGAHASTLHLWERWASTLTSRYLFLLLPTLWTILLLEFL